VAFAMSVFMLSLLGFPGTAGFIGKWMILSTAVGAGQTALAVALVLASVLSAGYYLPVVMAMYMKPQQDSELADRATVLGGTRVVIVAAAVALLLFGVWPNRALDVARTSSRELSAPTGVMIGLPRE
jgi:NADH-quinone oxidoreductase subunit N